jgi:hypothetical protein
MPNPAQPEDSHLDELRRQREFVARHLAWLDSEIARAAQEFSPPVPPSAFTPVAPVPLEIAPPPPVATPAAASTPDTPASVDALLPEPDNGLREKYGCIAILAIIALLILGALFGLPYLLPGFR